MSVQAALEAGRRAAEALMLDHCTITRGGGTTFDDDTGTYTPDAGTVLYDGVCKLQTREVQALRVNIAGAEGTVVDWTVHVPIAGTEDVRPGDTVTLTSGTFDGALRTRTFTVDGPHMGTAKTARRLPVRAEVSTWL